STRSGAPTASVMWTCRRRPNGSGAPSPKLGASTRSDRVAAVNHEPVNTAVSLRRTGGITNDAWCCCEVAPAFRRGSRRGPGRIRALQSQRENLMYRTFVAMGAVAIVVTAVMAQGDPIAQRKSLMKSNGQNSAAVNRMVRGEDPFDAAKA